ncbi:MAG: PD40 domain-containing protein [Planctomycetaceae bacterium]|nr:PD40 domain-containing protein [Planctomycetaceae bacterium]
MSFLILALLLAPQAEKVSFDEKVLATIPEGVIAKDVTFFKDGRQVAYRAIANGKMYVCVNSTKGPDYPVISDGLKWSNSGKLAYRVVNGTSSFAVVGGQPGASFQSVGMPVFSPDGNKFAYECNRGGTNKSDSTAWAMNVNGQKQADWASCGQAFWSGDSATVGYYVRIGKPGTPNRPFHTEDALVLGGKMLGEFEHVSNPFFAPKGSRWAYRTNTPPTWTMMVDGKAQETATDMGDAIWSPDGQHVAYRCGSRGKVVMVIDGKKTQEYPDVGDPVWSPNGKICAFIAKADANAGEYIVYGDQKTDVFSRCYPPVFSADSAHMAYAARSENGKYMVILDEKRGPAEFEAVGSIQISPDGQHVAFAGQWNFRWTCVIDSGRSSMNDILQNPVWGPDSKKVAYAAQNLGKWFVEVNYRRGDDLDEVFTPPVFSSDGKRCAYGARKGNELKWHVVQVAD